MIRRHDPVLLVMHPSPAGVYSPNSLREASRLLRDRNIGAVLVGNREHPVGVLSERDIVIALADGADPDEVWAADAMTFSPMSVPADATIEYAASLMAAAHIRHLTVEQDGRVVGILSIRDLLEPLVDDVRVG